MYGNIVNKIKSECNQNGLTEMYKYLIVNYLYIKRLINMCILTIK